MNLLLWDVGNSAVKIAVSSGNGLEAMWRLPISTAETLDSLGLALTGLLARFGCLGRFDACLAVSVVPALNKVLSGACRRYLGLDVSFAGAEVEIPLRNEYEQPAQLGADRLVAAYAARKLLPEPASLIVMDYGTALTIDCIEGETFLGGFIFPGPGTSQAALAGAAARLGCVELEPDDAQFMPGRDTASCIRRGLIYGYAAIAEGFGKRLKDSLRPPAQVVATGSFACLVEEIVPVFDVLIPGLVLLGLERLYMEIMAG